MCDGTYELADHVPQLHRERPESTFRDSCVDLHAYALRQLFLVSFTLVILALDSSQAELLRLYISRCDG
jgi:hypothetical protein